ncbi:MAG: ShlB/FhaC/HecB family hemolysin secretion/activation protein [Phycisphaerales bacterium]|nr:ShlB/FhaC/HecB family hemolysin secretion/activation protein [Phycisphaerales bacterium]
MCGTIACVTLIGCASSEPAGSHDPGMAAVESESSDNPALEVATSAEVQPETGAEGSGGQPGMVIERGELPAEYGIDIDEADMARAEPAPDRSRGERLPDAGDGRARLVNGFEISGLSAWGLSESDVMRSRVRLTPTASGWVGARGDDRGAKDIRLSQLAAEPMGVVLYDSALSAIHNQIAAMVAKDHPLHFTPDMMSAFSVDQDTGMAVSSLAVPGGIVGDSGPYLVRNFQVLGLDDWNASNLMDDVSVRVRDTDFGYIAATDGGRKVDLDRLGGDDVLVYQSVLDAAGDAVASAMQARFPHLFQAGSLGSFTVDETTGVATLTLPEPGAIPGDDGPYLVRGFVVEGLGAWGIPDDTARVRVKVEETGLGLMASDEGRAMSLGDLGNDRMLYKSVLDGAGAAINQWLLDRHKVAYGAPISFTRDQDSGIAVAMLTPPGPLDGDSTDATLVRTVEVLGADERGLSETDVLDVTLPLAKAQDGFFAPRSGLGSEMVRVGDLPTLDGWGAYLYDSAVRAIAVAVSDEAKREGQAAVRVAINLTDDGTLRLTLTQGTISALRTVVNPEGEEPSLNEPGYDQIREHSPVQEGDLVDIEALDSYVHRLNRRPGRQVDVALAPGVSDSDLTLDYLVGESDPFMLYAQASNTGTEETSEWRERFGLAHYNLTNFDDVLSLDYITGDFNSVHAFTGSYERPFRSFIDTLRWRVFAKWIDYDASEVGFGGSAFEGTTFGVGGELIWNVYQNGPGFVDLVGGVRYEDVSVDNNLIDVTGESSFVLPYLGARYDRQTPRGNTMAGAFIEWGSASENPDELAELGRFDVADSWTVVRWDASQSLFLDPIFGAGWNDGSEATPTLAHEVVVSTTGQISLGDRLVPNFVETIGGFYSVRGYPEAFAFGDRVYTGSLEYRFHLPRAFGVSDPVQFFKDDSFRYAPQEALGPTDWDLIFRAFLDAGRAEHENPLIFEDDATLVGAGLGVELTLYRNVSLRLDWGVALKEAEVDNEKVTAGSSRLHMAFTLVF